MTFLRILALCLLAPFLGFNLSAANSAKAQIVEAENRTEKLIALANKDVVDLYSWSPDGRHLWGLGNSPQGTLKCYDASTGKRVVQMSNAAIFEGLEDKKLATGLFCTGANGVYILAGSRWWKATFESTGWQLLDPRESAVLDARWSPHHKNSSKSDIGRVMFLIRNSSLKEIKLVYTVDGKATEINRIVAAGNSVAISSYPGHMWQVLSAESESLGEVVIPQGGCVYRYPHLVKKSQEKKEKPKPLFVGIHNNQVAVNSDGKWRELSADGDDLNGYAATEISPDQLFAAAARYMNPSGEFRKIHYVESSPKDQLQPVLHKQTYIKPGDPLSQWQGRVFSLQERKVIELDKNLLGKNLWRLNIMGWSSDSRDCFFLAQYRGHQRRAVFALDVKTGQTRVIVDEHSSTFIDYSYKTWYKLINDGRELLWMSETRDGWNHIYRFDCRDGRLLNTVTKGRFVVRSVEKVNEKDGVIHLVVSGFYEDQDPYYKHLMVANLDGSKQTMVTGSNGNHSWSYSPNGTFVIANWSRIDHPPVTELRSVKDGKLIAELDRQQLAPGYPVGQPFKAKGRDGKTDIYGVIIRPSFYKKGMKLPIVEQIYAGPHGFICPKSWRQIPYQVRKLAELGFAVVIIDGMGTNWRSKAFHDVCWKNLKDAGFPDRRAWMQAAAKAHPELDLERVGIYGTSAGGQNALAALLHQGDFYKAAVSSAGCHDNRMDKIWWNEAWMGWPIGPHYVENSNVTHAAKLERPLLLAVGEMDRNVDPSSTLQVVDALIKADRDFDFIFVPGGDHFVISSPYVDRRMNEFFLKHLGPVAQPVKP